MGFFDKLFTGTQTEYQYKSKSEQEAWMAIIYAAVCSDGEVSDSEINSIVATVQMKEIFRNSEPLDSFKTVGLAWQKVGSQGLVDGAYNIIEEKMRPTLFAIVTEMILADGVATKEEQSTLEYISTKLGIHGDIASEIIEVMLIKAKGNVR